MAAHSVSAWREYINPRYELILLTSAVFEVCWAFGFFAMALTAMSGGQKQLPFALFAALTLVAVYGSRFLLNLNLPERRQRSATIALAIASTLLVVRMTLFPEYALFNLSWIGDTIVSVGKFFIGFSPIALLMLMGVYAWWRGISLAQGSYDFESVGFRFRLGVLMMALLGLLNTWIGRFDLSGLLVAYFFCSLMAVALARQEDIGRTDSAVSLPLKGPWLGILTGSALLVIGFGGLLAIVLSPQGIRAILGLLSPLQPLLFLILYVILFAISIVVELIFNLVVLAIRNLGLGSGRFEGFRLPQRPPLDVLQNQSDFSALAAYMDPVSTVCAVMLFIGMLLMLALSLNRLQKRRDAHGNETRESVPVRLDLNPFKRLRELFRRPQFDLDESGIISIRRIYANLARLAAKRGYPRREAETPYEFMRELRAAFAGVEPEERLITEAYVRVHYGEHDPTPEETRQVREAWRKIKEQNDQQTDRSNQTTKG